MKQKMTNIVTAFFILLLAVGCAQKPMLVPHAYLNNIDASRNSLNRIVLVEPKISFKEVATDQELDPELYGGGSLAEFVKNNVKETVRHKNIDIINVDEIADVDSNLKLDILPNLSQNSDKLLRQRFDKKSISNDLMKIRDVTGADGIIFHYITVKVGRRGTWDPNTGAMTGGTTTSDVIAFLVDVRSGEIIWKNEVFYRDFLEKENLISSFQMLYASFLNN